MRQGPSKLKATSNRHRGDEMAGLANGSRFPTIEMQSVGGELLVLPDVLEGTYGVVLAYRGSWCTRCNAQLSLFQQALAQLVREGIGVVAFSTDAAAHAHDTVARHGIEFPVGYGVDVEDASALLKSYTNDTHRSLESSNFLLRPDGTIELCVYASGPIGRLFPDDVIDIVRRRRSR